VPFKIKYVEQLLHLFDNLGTFYTE